MTTPNDAVVDPATDTEPTAKQSESRGRLRSVLPRGWRWFRLFVGGVGQWSAKRKTAVFVPLCVLFAALVVAVSLLGLKIHSNDGIADAQASALAAANASVPKLLSYKFESVEKDLGDASNALTGDFKDQFVALTQQSIIPAAKQGNIVTSASVAGNSVVSASDHSVTVLMFLNQSTTSKDSPNPKLDSSRVRVNLLQIGDEWLISNLQPV